MVAAPSPPLSRSRRLEFLLEFLRKLVARHFEIFATLSAKSGHPESFLAVPPHARSLATRDGDEWREGTDSISEILFLALAQLIERQLG
jgi:hypothetical protein